MTETILQRKIIKFLKDNGVYVIKTRPGSGTPVGCPDIVGLTNFVWIVIEVKKSEKAPFRVGQKSTLDYLRTKGVFVYVAYPENWDEIRLDINNKLFTEFTI